MRLTSGQRALVEIGRALQAAGYRFVTPTPETHRRANQRFAAARGATHRTLRDVFGWSRPFQPTDLGPPLLALAQASDILVPAAETGFVTSRVRFSTLESADGELLFVHSAFPTVASDAVFFGPDSYRFAQLLARTVTEARRLVDVGCGAGVGGIVLARRARQVVLADVSRRALELAQVNIALAGLDTARISVRESDVLAGVEGDADVIVANPPYVVGPDDPAQARLYRDGGGALGIELAVRIAGQALDRLQRGGGRLVLYTGVPIVDGRDPLRDQLDAVLRARAAAWSWQELDPDVFGEELDRPAYRRIGAERLAVVALDARVDGAPLPAARLSPP